MPFNQRRVAEKVESALRTARDRTESQVLIVLNKVDKAISRFSSTRHPIAQENLSKWELVRDRTSSGMVTLRDRFQWVISRFSGPLQPISHAQFIDRIPARDPTSTSLTALRTKLWAAIERFSRPNQFFSQRGASNQPARERRVLFLDDDPLRAEVFLAEHPQAVWVQTAADCVVRLAEHWDEVHLDHDLGGEQFVDLNREDCGMEVVRWLCLQFRPHLKKTQFYVHSHNLQAATTMTFQLMVTGYSVEARPFRTTPAAPGGLVAAEPITVMPPLPRISPWARFCRLIRRVLRRESPEDYGYSLTASTEPIEKLDLNWTMPRVESSQTTVARPDFSWTQPPPPPRPPAGSADTPPKSP